MKKEDIKLLAHKTGALSITFMLWWLSELSDMVPAPIKQKLTAPTTKTIIKFKNGQASAIGYEKGEPISLPNDLASHNAQTSPSRQSAHIALPIEEVFVGHFEVPALAQTKLHQAVSYEIERRSPFHARDALFDFSVSARHDDGSITIEWATIPLALSDEIEGMVRNMGYLPLSIGVSSENPEKFKYVFAKYRLPLSCRIRKSALVAIASFLFLFCATALAFVIRSEHITQAGHEATALKAEAIKAENSKMNAQKTIKAIAEISNRIDQTQSIDILREVTKTLPEDSWIVEFNLNGDQLKLIGYSSSAASLIEKFSAVSLFEHPRFLAPIIPQINAKGISNGERFELAMTIRNRSRMEHDK